MEIVPMPACAKDRWTKGCWMDPVYEEWVEPIERWTAKMAELCPTFEYQDIKTKFNSSRVYVSTGIELSADLTDDEYDKADEERIRTAMALQAMASEMEAELNTYLT